MAMSLTSYTHACPLPACMHVAAGASVSAYKAKALIAVKEYFDSADADEVAAT